VVAAPASLRVATEINAHQPATTIASYDLSLLASQLKICSLPAFTIPAHNSHTSVEPRQ
jgi:hypothetical protein